ncbi:MAG: peptidylprolyl isomerase [Phycisphaerae bacterium]
MNDPDRTRTMRWRISALLLSTWCAVTAIGEDPPEGAADPVQSLRAEVTVDRTLFNPSQPMPVRFTLFNPTREPIELPVTRTADDRDAITLPRALIIGSSEHPALLIAYENEKPVAVRPNPPRDAGNGVTDVLRLAPRASVGAEIDLSTVHRQLRYSGRYRVEWQPLGGKVAPVTLTFRVEPRKDADLITDYGKITFSLMYDKAPRNLENFLELARQRFYEGKTIHRVVPGFIIQGGSPDGSGTGIRPDGKFVAAEFHNTPFELGTLAMARKPNDPDSASCQFFISLGRLEELDGKYTIVGQARGEESFRTLQKIEQLPTNRDGRPTRPLIIRFFTLVDAPVNQARQLESSRP